MRLRLLGECFRNIYYDACASGAYPSESEKPR